MHTGHHFRDVPRATRRWTFIVDNQMPRTIIHDFIASVHWEQPVLNNNRNNALNVV
jgi:hypothetical protein